MDKKMDHTIIIKESAIDKICSQIRVQSCIALITKKPPTISDYQGPSI